MAVCLKAEAQVLPSDLQLKSDSENSLKKKIVKGMAFKLQKKTMPWGLLKESKVLPKKSQNRIWQSLQLSQLCKILISHFFLNVWSF